MANHLIKLRSHAGIQIEVSYFKELPFKPAALPCLRIEEILAEKIRATYQRDKPRDIWDINQFSGRPMPEALIRKLVVAKLWQVCDAFSPQQWFKKLEQAVKWDWDDLRQLVRDGVPDPRLMLERCAKRFAFLHQLDVDEKERLPPIRINAVRMCINDLLKNAIASRKNTG